jgi:hypothetical protein
MKPDRRPLPAPTPASVVGGIAFKGALELLPGGSVLYDLIQARQSEIAEAMAAERQRRLDTFWSEMLSAQSSMNEQQARALLDSADFHALLRACLTDIEDEKLREYAVMACSIATGAVPKSNRRHFLLCLRDLSSEELGLLRGAYIARQAPNMISGHGSGNASESEYLDAGPPGGFRAIHISTLASKGLVHEGKLTPLGRTFVKAAWRESDLTPSSLGRETWSGYHVAIVNYEIGRGTLDALADQLARGFHSHRCKSSILAVTRENAQRVLLASSGSTRLAVLLLSGSTPLISDHSEALRHFVARVPTVALLADPLARIPDGVPIRGKVEPTDLDPQQLIAEVMEKLIGAYAAQHGDA